MPIRTPAQNQKGETSDRYAWVGDHFVFITVSDDLNPSVMHKLVDIYGSISRSYLEVLGDSLPGNDTFGGRGAMVEDDTQGSALSASFGSTHYGVVSWVFSRIYGSAAERDECDDVGFYWALSVNHWRHGSQLTPADSPFTDAFFGGFGMSMRILAGEALAQKFAAFKVHGGSECRGQIEELLKSYLADPALTIENTLGARTVPANQYNLGAGDFLAAFCLRLCQDNGGDAFAGKALE